jgi:hypothetical protein
MVYGEGGDVKTTREETREFAAGAVAGLLRIARMRAKGSRALLIKRLGNVIISAHFRAKESIDFLSSCFKDSMAGRTPNVKSVGISYMYGGKWIPNKSRTMGSGSEFQVGPHIMIIGLIKRRCRH